MADNPTGTDWTVRWEQGRERWIGRLGSGEWNEKDGGHHTSSQYAQHIAPAW